MLRRLMFLILFSRLACAATIAITPAVTSIGLGQTFSLAVTVVSVTDLYAYQFDLAFDPAALRAVEVTEGGYLTSGGATLFLAGSIDNVAGVVSATADTLLGPVAGVSGGGALATFRFQSLSSGATTLALFNTFLLDSNLFTLDVTPFSAEVDVAQAAEPGALGLVLGGLVLLPFGRRVLRGHPVGRAADGA